MNVHIYDAFNDLLFSLEHPPNPNYLNALLQAIRSPSVKTELEYTILTILKSYHEPNAPKG